MEDELKAIGLAIVAYIVVLGALYGINKTINWFLNYLYRISQKQQKFEGMSVDEACDILGIKKKDLKRMTKSEIKSAFRKKAMEAHPDRGGSDEEFRKVHMAYEFAYAM
jgi:hypothetical protein